MKNMKSSDYLFFLIKSLTSHEKRHFKLESNFQSGDDKTYIKVFDAIDKMEDKYEEETVLKIFSGDKKKLSVGKNFLYNKILRSLRTYNEQSSIDIQLVNLISEVQILMQKGLFYPASKQLNKAKKLAITYERSMLLVKIIDIQIDIQNHIGGQETKEKYEELFEDASKVLEDYMERLELKRLNRALHVTVQSGEKQLTKYLSEIEHLPKSAHTLNSFYAKNNYYSVLAYYHRATGDYNKSMYYLNERVQLWRNHPKIQKTDYQLYRIYISNYLSGCIRAENNDEILPIVEEIKKIPAKSNYEKASTFQNADYFELLYYIETLKYEKAIELVSKIEKNLIAHQDSILESRRLSFCYNITIAFFGLKKYEEAKDWLNKILYNPKAVLRANIRRFAWVLEVILHDKLENDRVLQHIFNSAQFPLNQPAPHPFEVLAFGHLKKIVFALTGRRELYKDFQRDLDEFTKKNNHFGLDFLATWVEANARNRSFIEIQEEWYRKRQTTNL